LNIEKFIGFYYIPPMNIFKLSALCLLATVSAFAQFPLEEQPAPVASSSSSSEIAVVPPPPASSSSLVIETSSSSVAEISSSSVAETKIAASPNKTVFDSLRGHAYNPYSTVGAASTVYDLITTPSDINGQKFAYISPTDYLGYAAFPLGSGTAMLGLDNSSSGYPAALVLGYANSIFGVVLNYSVAKNWRWVSDNAQDLDYKIRETYDGDNIGLYVSAPFNSLILYANANWLTYESSSENINGRKLEYDDSMIQANVGFTDRTGPLNYDISLNASRYNKSFTIPNGHKAIYDAYWGFALNFNMGYTALQNSFSKLIVGANSYFYTVFLDKTEDSNSDNKIGFRTMPNILMEISLFDNWLTFAGAVQDLRLIAGDGDGNSNTSSFDIRHSGSWAFAGIRYQKTKWAMEAQVNANMFNNPFRGFAGSDMFTAVGGFVYF